MKNRSRPAEDCYHRLLTAGEQDETELVDDYLKENSLAALYDSVLVPVHQLPPKPTRATAGSTRSNSPTSGQSLRVILDDLAMRPAASDQIKEEQIEAAHRPNAAPAPDLPRLLRARPRRTRRVRRRHAHPVTPRTKLRRAQRLRHPSAAELLDQLEADRSDIACISVVAPSTVIHARFLCTETARPFPRAQNHRRPLGRHRTRRRSHQTPPRFRRRRNCHLPRRRDRADHYVIRRAANSSSP